MVLQLNIKTARMFSAMHYTRRTLEGQQSGISLSLLVGRARVMVLVELLKDLQCELVCGGLIHMKL
jgi:hypothetical protein